MALQVINPYNRQVYTELAYDTDSQIAAKIATARETFAAWHRLPLEERMATVSRSLEYFRIHKDRIAEEISCQMGKPIVQSRNEFGGFFERAEHMLKIAPDSLAPDRLPPKEGFFRRIDHTPLGVVLDLAAWNYPLLIPVNIVVPALLAGNTVLIKHSAKTPLCGLHFEKAFSQSMPGLVQNLIMTHDQTLKLIRNNPIDHVVFTGSVPGGREIYRSAANRLLDVGLELGGKDPAYVAEDADLDFSVANVVDGACYNAGQSCCAIERVYVHRKQYPAFIAGVREALDAYRMGDPLDDKTTLGPLASRSTLQLLDRQVSDALGRGAQVLAGGKALADATGNFYLPTLLTEVPNEAEAMQDESFGPLLPVCPVNNDREALKLMNDSRFGLTASVWTSDQERAEWFARRLHTGTVYQNRCDYLDPGLPWTGVGESGLGSSLSKYGFYHLTRRKSIHFRTRT